MECAKSEDILIVQCEKNMTITNITAMQKLLCEMKANGVVVLPKDVSIIAVPRDVRVVY
jgi:hypothetical protein